MIIVDWLPASCVGGMHVTVPWLECSKSDTFAVLLKRALNNVTEEGDLFCTPESGPTCFLSESKDHCGSVTRE